MSFFDDLLQKITPSPGMEKFLSSIPELVGAYESARGKPMGAPLQMLGQFGDQNAALREQKGNANALTQLIKTFNPQNAPIAAGLYKQYEPSMDQMTPDARIAELQNIQNVGEREQLKPVKFGKDYYNPQTGKLEQHGPGDDVSNLIPWGQGAFKMMAAKNNWPVAEGAEKEKTMMWDAHAMARYGMDYAHLYQTNPKAAAAVQDEVARLGPNASLSNRETMLPLENNAILARQQEMQATTPHDAFERDVLTYKGLNPEQYRALPSDKQKQIHDEIVAQEAADAAVKTNTESNERAKIGREAGIQKWKDTPLMKSGYFAVDPKTFEMKMSPEDTIQTAQDKNYALVPKSFQNGFQQGSSALAGLDALNHAGRAVLPATGGSVPSTALMIDAQYMLGNKDATVYKAQKLNLIPLLRTLAGTSRPNQKEIDLAVKTLQNVANQQDLVGAVGVAQRAVRKALGNMMTVGAGVTQADKASAASSAALGAVTGVPPTDVPDPGYSVSY
jgi:hypothetical protein